MLYILILYLYINLLILFLLIKREEDINYIKLIRSRMVKSGYKFDSSGRLLEDD